MADGLAESRRCGRRRTAVAPTATSCAIPPAKRGGNKRTADVREVVNGPPCILSTGRQWAAMPKDPAPRSTVHDAFDRWDWDGTWRASIMRFTCNAVISAFRAAKAPGQAATPAQPRPSLRAKASRAPKKGVAHRPAGP